MCWRDVYEHFSLSDKEDDVHHDFAWTITNFSRKINMVPNGEYIESDKVHNIILAVYLDVDEAPLTPIIEWSLVFSHSPWHGS